MTDDLRQAILEEAEKSHTGEVLLEGWQLGIYEAQLTDDGEVEWCLSEKAEELIARGEMEEYIERETRGIEVEASALPREPLSGGDEA